MGRKWGRSPFNDSIVGPAWDNYVNMHLSNHGTDSEVSDVS